MKFGKTWKTENTNRIEVIVKDWLTEKVTGVSKLE